MNLNGRTAERAGARKSRTRTWIEVSPVTWEPLSDITDGADRKTSRTVIDPRLVETASTISGRLKFAWTEALELETAVGFGRDRSRAVTVPLEVDAVKIAVWSSSRILTAAEETGAANG